MDTGSFTTNKDGGDGYKACRKALQEAFKDINEVLQPKPKLNIMMGTDKMAEVVVAQIAACIGQDAVGNPTWTNPAAVNLSPDTIKLYEWCVGQRTQESIQDPNSVAQTVGKEQMAFTNAEGEEIVVTTAQDAAQAAEDIYLADGEECPGWVKKAGPTNPKYEAICLVCSRLAACADRAGAAKPKAGAKKTAGEKAVEKVQKDADKAAAKEAKKAERAAAKAAGKLATRVRTDGPSNKQKVFVSWKANQTKTADILGSEVDGAIKTQTIKSWIGSWKHGKNLPAGSTV